VIFVTVGTEFPFDRLVRAMDAWAAAHPAETVLAQIGTGTFEPAHMTWHRRMGRSAYAEAVTAAELVVAHAGIGSVVTAGEHGKPVVLLPRLARFGEQRNDHQLDTAAKLGGRPGICIAADEGELAACIAAAKADGRLQAMGKVAPDAFLARLRDFIRR
jgi:UDP-N-acetylglucosamine transferase subunit ALG13